MTRKENGFLGRLRETFRVEAGEHLAALATGLSDLAKAPVGAQAAIVETIFREAHSLKGAARSVSLPGIESASHALETAFAALKKEETTVSPALVEAAQQVVDGMVTALSSSPEPAADDARLRELGRRVEDVVRARRPPAPADTPVPALAGPAPGPAAPGSVRIAAARLDALLRQSEEMLGAKQLAGRLPAELREVAGNLAAWKKEWARVAADVRAAESMRARHPQLGRLADFTEWSYSFLMALHGRVTESTRTAAADQRAVESAVDRLQEDVRQALLLPFSTLLEGFPRLVRELCRERGKEAELVIRGGEVEIDRRILEEIKDPLVHLARNCIDHGVEAPDERTRRGKPPRATIAIAIAHHERSAVEITVADDGAGIDAAAVRGAAVRLGVLSSEEASSLDDGDLLPVVFASGLSTSTTITSVSGRGLGLAIVREKAERLGGTVSLETVRGAGTSFRVVLPLTLASLRSLLVLAGGRTFALPTSGVERAVRVEPDALATVENRVTVNLGGELLAVASLAAALELPQEALARGDGAMVPLVVVAAGGRRIALVVDEILLEQEVLLKTLGPQLPRVRNVAGATILADGSIVPILYLPDVVRSAVLSAGAPRQAPAAETPAGRAKSILVVEDSITARSLLRNILEAAGFAVRTAVDGVDGLTALRSEGADLVVSDVDMPRMGGFELTAKIRSDRRLAELPVVLVTALESREDRERGIDVGANAYIVKSSFDQSNLLAVVRRLV